MAQRPPAPRMNTGTVALQLGAFSASSRAERAWNTIDKRAGSLTPDLTVTFPSVFVGGRTLCRVIVAPSVDRSAATDRCEALKHARARYVPGALLSHVANVGANQNLFTDMAGGRLCGLFFEVD
ncbi:MAG: hypothetical protein ACI9W2_003182 [Gammaproteobacteria bacterium]|jgi:hypothetical protein